MAKITAARKEIKQKNKGLLAKASKALRPKGTQRTTAALRKSITPGTVLILLAGAHKGKRVVFLKQLDSGLLLVTGPFKINGVPVRRVNQAYVIATSTKVELPAAAVEAVAGVNDAFFNSMKAEVTKESKKFFETEKKETKVVTTQRVELQKKVDAALLPAIKAAGKEFGAYLGSSFSLSKNQFPHLLKF